MRREFIMLHQSVGPRLRTNTKGSKSPYKSLESKKSVAQPGCVIRVLKVLSYILKSEIVVIPMPHSRIFETGPQFRAH